MKTKSGVIVVVNVGEQVSSYLLHAPPPFVHFLHLQFSSYSSFAYPITPLCFFV